MHSPRMSDGQPPRVKAGDERRDREELRRQEPRAAFYSERLAKPKPSFRPLGDYAGLT